MTTSELNKQLAILKKQAALQQEINGSLEGYINGLKTSQALNKTIEDNTKTRLKLQANLNKAIASGNAADIKMAQDKLQILDAQTKELQEQADILNEALKDAKKFKLALAAGAAGAVKGFSKLPSLMSNSFGKLKGWGLFEMDKQIKASTLEMGLLGNQAKFYNNNVRETAVNTNAIGINIGELTKLQTAYSDEVGRTVMLSDKSLTAMSELAAATSLGVEGTSQMAADMEAQGISAEKTRDLIEESLNKSSKMGINGNKVIKNMLNNMKLLNKYNFKDGVKGLEKMSQTVTKLGVGMEFASGFADKLFDIEGAVDMSAQLQVMGGAWANLADPFKLAYMARNDMEGLTKELGNAAKASVKFNKESGEFEVSAYEMDKLRKISEQTGVSLDELVTAGKKARKFAEIDGQISFKIDDDVKDFLTNTAEFKNGKAVIDIKGDGTEVLVSSLNDAQIETIKQQVALKKSLAERAKDSKTFDEKLTNLINMMKVTMMPIIDGINDVLGPVVDNIMNNKEFKNKLVDLGKDLGGFIKSGAEIAKTLTKVINYLGPGGLLGLFVGGKIAGIFFDKITWFSNGLALAKGFQAGSAVGGAAGRGGSMLAGGAMRNGGNWMKGGGYALAGAGVGALTDWGSEKAKESGNEGLGKGIGVLGKSAEYALYGAAIGSLIPVLGTTIGAIAGGVIGAGKGLYDQYNNNEAVNNPNYTKPINDGIIHGSNHSLGRGIIQGGNITPIDNKDDLLAMKPNGPVDNTLKNNKSDTIKIEFGEIKFKFEDLKIVSPGNPGISINLLNDPTFIRNLTSMIHVETAKTINGGLVKG